MSDAITYVGIDAHVRELQLAMLVGDTAHTQQWTCPNEPRAIERLRRKLVREAPGLVECCYEAGPVGFQQEGTPPFQNLSPLTCPLA